MKILCGVCKTVEELTKEEIDEIAKFIKDNELEAVDYLSYISLKRGRKCKGVDGKSDKLKRHVFLFDNGWQEEIIEIAKKAKQIEDEKRGLEQKITELEQKIAELEKNKKESEECINQRKEELSIIVKNIEEMTGIDDYRLWV